MARQESLSRRSGARPHLPDLGGQTSRSHSCPALPRSPPTQPEPTALHPTASASLQPPHALGGPTPDPGVCTLERQAAIRARPPGRQLMASPALPPAAAF